MLLNLNTLQVNVQAEQEEKKREELARKQAKQVQEKVVNSKFLQVLQTEPAAKYLNNILHMALKQGKRKVRIYLRDIKFFDVKNDKQWGRLAKVLRDHLRQHGYEAKREMYDVEVVVKVYLP